jgi:DNA-binding transcriptional LysR family regulator
MVGIVDSVLAAKNLERHVVAAAPYFLTALATVSRSDAITTMPSSIARAHAKDLGLRLFSCPVPIRPLKVNLLSSNRISSDPLNPWVAQIICDVAAKQVCPHSAAPRQRVKGARGKRRAV